MRLCDHFGAEVAVVARVDATEEERQLALDSTEAVLVLGDLFLGIDGPDGSLRDALLEMAGGSRFDLFWRRPIAELKDIVATDLGADRRLIMVRSTPPRGVPIQADPGPVPAAPPAA